MKSTVSHRQTPAVHRDYRRRRIERLHGLRDTQCPRTGTFSNRSAEKPPVFQSAGSQICNSCGDAGCDRFKRFHRTTSKLAVDNERSVRLSSLCRSSSDDKPAGSAITPIDDWLPHTLLNKTASPLLERCAQFRLELTPNQSAHATPAPTRSWTTSSREIWKPEDTGLRAADSDKNGFVGRLRRPSRVDRLVLAPCHCCWHGFMEVP